MKSQSYVILAIVFVIIVAVFAVFNVSPVEVNYLFWTGESPLILVILFSVLMGGIITATSGMVKMYRMQREIKALKKENLQLLNEKEARDSIEQNPDSIEIMEQQEEDY